MRTDLNLENARILLVDDTPANLDLLCAVLEKEGCRLSIAPNGRVALEVVRQHLPELILLDVVMPGMDGFEVCRLLKQNTATADIPVIFITAKGLTENIVDGFDVGGVDYITKPFQDKEVLARVRTHLSVGRLNRALVEKNRELEEEVNQRQKLKGRLSQLSAREAERWGLEELIGESPTMQQIFKDIRLLRENSTSALITGESGTGKELIARALHYGSPRREGPFVPVNCSALPRELAESLLFGHLKGAFTGADADRAGCFETAHEGTLFLDEIGELPLELQPKLLRVLEDGQVQRLGSHQSQPVDVRIVAATNVDLPNRINEGAFRSDLYYRLARFTIMAPPLRHRREDIPLLVRHLLHQLAEEMGREAPPLTEAALDTLTAYEFPGNVRQLKNIVERLLIENRGTPVRNKDLYFLTSETLPAVESGDEQVPLGLDELEQWAIRRALSRTRGNVSEAARILSVSRNRVYRVLSQAEEDCAKN